MADNVEVKLGAQTGDLQSAFVNAATSLRESTQQMVAALKGLEGQSKETHDKARQNAQGIGAAFGEMKDKVGGHINGVTSALEKFKTFAIGLGAIFAGGFLFKSAIDAMFHMEGEVLKLQNVFGMLSDEATHTAMALEIIGKSADDLTGIGLKLARQLKADEENVKRLGVVTRDAATGDMLKLNVIMQNAFETMQTYRSGTDQAEFALSVFGRSVNDVYDIMVRLPAAQERAKQLQKELGEEWGPEKVARIEQYRIELGATRVIMGNIADNIGDAVLPSLHGLAMYFNDVGPSAVKAIVNAIKGLIVTFDVLVTAVKIVAIAVGSFLQAVAVNVDTVIALLNAAAHPSLWGTIPSIIDRNTQKVVAITKKAVADVVAEWDGAGKRIAGLLADNASSAPGAGPLKSGTRSFVAKPGPAESRMSQWQAELAAQRDAYDAMKLQQGSFEQWSIQQTVDYWNSIKARGDLSVKERAEVERNYFGALRTLRQEAFTAEISALEQQKDEYRYASQERINIATAEYNLEVEHWGQYSAQATKAYKQVIDERRKLSDQLKAIDDIRSKQVEAYAEHDIKIEEMMNTQDVALRRISVEQKLAMDADLENRRFDIAMEGLRRRQATEEKPEAKAALDLQIEALELSHQEKLTQIQNAAILERNTFVIGAQEAVQASTATLFNDLISHTKSLKDALNDFVKSLTASLNKLASDAIAKQLFGGGSAGGSIVGSLFGGGGGGGGFDLSNFLFSFMPSAADGTNYVPRDMPVFVHAGEAIVPARYNAGGLAAPQTHNNVNIHFALSGAVDSRTQDQIAARTARAVQRATNRNV